MKKNFIKQLAFVSAFAMTVTALAPAAGVFAAKAPALSAKSKTLLLNDEDRTEYDFNVKYKVKGSTYKWTTNNAKVATVKKNGVVEAKAVGKATIKVVITLPTGKTKTLSAPVTVKENMETITISNPAKEAIKVGATYNFDRNYTTVTGGKTTDITRWEVVGDNAAKASIKNNGVFTATEAGEYEVVALGFQSAAKYNAYLAGDTSVATAKSAVEKIVVVASIESVKLLTPKQIQLTFDSSVKDVVKAKEDVSVKLQLTGGNTAMVPVFTFDGISEDGKVVTVSTYDNLVDKQTYLISAADSEVSFLAQIGSPVSISMDNQTVAAGVSTKVKYVLLDQFGVDVSSLFDAQVVKNSSVPFDAGNAGYLTLGDKVVSFVEYNYTIFNTADGTYKTISTGTKTITGASATVGSELDWNIGSANFSTTSKTIVAGDNSKVIYGRILKSDGTYTATSNYKFESLNQAILMIDSNTNQLIPLTQGTALVKVSDLNNNVIAYINVNVLAASATAYVKASNAQVVLSNSISNVPETTQVNILNVDQYGTETAATIDRTNSYPMTTTRTTDIANISVSGNTITFTAVTGKTGSFNYYVKTSEGKIVTVSVTVATPGVLSTYTITANEDSIDAYVANTDTSNTVDFTVYGVDYANVKKEKVIAGAVTGQTITYTVTGPNNFTQVLTDTNSDGTVTFTVDDTSATVTTGTYTFTVSINGIKYTKSFEVKNTREVPTKTIKALSTTAATGSAVKDALLAMVEIKVGNTVLTAANIVDVEFYSSNSAVVVNNGDNFTTTTGVANLYVTKVIVTFGGVQREVTLNTSLKVTVQ